MIMSGLAPVYKFFPDVGSRNIDDHDRSALYLDVSGSIRFSLTNTNQMSNQSLLLTFAVAIFIGGALKDFFQAIITGLVVPFFVLFSSDTQNSVGELTVQVGPVKLKVGEVISATATLVIALVVTAAVLPYLRAYSPLQGGKRA